MASRCDPLTPSGLRETIGRMFTLALSFTRHTTLRLQEVAGAALAVGGALSFIGSSMPFGRRGGQALGGLCVAAAGVLLVLSFRYGA